MPRDSFAKSYKYNDRITPGGFMIEGRPALTGIDPALVGDYVVMVVRDPLLAYEADPAELISRRFDDRTLAGQSGMFTTYTGTYKGARISVVSGGSGAPEAELVLVEFMHHTRASTFLRLGGGAALGDEVKSGDVIIASGVVRDDGMSKCYITPGFPAAASYELVVAMATAAGQLDIRCHIGTGRSGDSEHVGCGRPSVDGYFQPGHDEIIDYYNRAGVLYWDRESSAVVTLCNLFGRRGGAVVSVDNNLITNESFTAGDGQDKATEIVLEGLANLKKMDDQKNARGQRYWTPGEF